MHITLQLTRSSRAHESHAARLASETYLVRVVTSDEAGMRDAPLETSSLDWRKLMPQLDALHDDSRNARLRDRIGKLLRKFLGGTDWNLHEARIKEARSRPGEAIHVTVRADADELFLVPWELVKVKSLNLPLAALDQVVIGHAWPGTDTVTTGGPPGRALVAWSAAGGSVPMASHVAVIGDACASPDSGLDFASDRDILAVTPRSLDDELSATDRPPVTALHLLCHGTADGNGYRLAWNGNHGDGVAYISPDDLAGWLAPFAGSLRLVTLCACESGDSVKGDRELGGIAQAVHRVGIPWVIGSRYPLSVHGSVTFAATFYERLMQQASVERAFAHARKQLSFDTDRRDHVSLQLYARAQDRGQPLFQPRQAAAPSASLSGLDSGRVVTTTGSQNRGLARLTDLALKLDRTRQWAHLRALCETSDRSHFVVVFGDQSQYVNLFCERIQRYFNDESPRPHMICRLRFTDQDSTPTVVEDWDERLVEALPFGSLPEPDKMLRLATQNQPIVLILGDRPLTGLDREQSQALAEFVGVRLPALIDDLPAHHQPVRVLIPIEQTEANPGARSPVIAAMGDAAGKAHEIGIDTAFVRLGFPEWEDIESFLGWTVTDHVRACADYQGLVDDCRRAFHDIAGRPAGQRDFAELTTRLHELLEALHAPDRAAR